MTAPEPCRTAFVAPINSMLLHIEMLKVGGGAAATPPAAPLISRRSRHAMWGRSRVTEACAMFPSDVELDVTSLSARALSAGGGRVSRSSAGPSRAALPSVRCLSDS